MIILYKVSNKKGLFFYLFGEREKIKQLIVSQSDFLSKIKKNLLICNLFFNKYFFKSIYN